MRKAKWWIGATAALLVGTLALVFLPMDSARPNPADTHQGAAATDAPAEDAALEHPRAIGAEDIRLGSEDAKVTVIEYGDFQCSNCAKYAPILRELQANYKDRVLFAYRFVPLDDSNGWIAAQAAYAAHLQGKFWQMYDLLYQHRTDWQDSSTPLDLLTDYARTIGLRTAVFVRDVTANSTLQFVTEQKSEARRDGVEELPTFIIDGRPVVSGSYDDLAELLDEALADAH
jgi:protein-disulfide isomerase